MNVLYVSSMCSEPMMHELFYTAQEKPHPAPQKYHSLMVKGLVANGCEVTCLVALPVTVRSHPREKWWKRKEEVVDGVRFVYMPFYNHPIPKLLGFKLYAFFFTLGWILRAKGEKAMICDVLNAHAFAAMHACLLLRCKAAGIITDIPGMMGSQLNSSWIRRWSIKINNENIKRLTHFIPLTEAMNDLYNVDRKKPFVVVEGLVDYRMKEMTPTPLQDGKRHLTYTGTLEAQYGVRTMIEAFMKLEQNDIVLDIYGKGPMAGEMDDYMKKDYRICYHGVVTIDEAVLAQRSSFLLVNPRPTTEEFTKYSFPSKNMEYMATGVPLLTAVLPGMPEEYHEHVFLFKDETAEGISRMMDEILHMPIETVRTRGQSGKRFVMEKKNNVMQGKRVLEMLMKQ